MDICDSRVTFAAKKVYFNDKVLLKDILSLALALGWKNKNWQYLREKVSSEKILLCKKSLRKFFTAFLVVNIISEFLCFFFFSHESNSRIANVRSSVSLISIAQNA